MNQDNYTLTLTDPSGNYKASFLLSPAMVDYIMDGQGNEFTRMAIRGLMTTLRRVMSKDTEK